MTDLALAYEPRAVLTRPAAAPDQVLRYGAHAHALIDLYAPTGAPRAAPLLVLVHGGYWRATVDRSYMRPMAEVLRAEGFVVVLPEYRRTGDEPGLEGGYPATLDDIAQALRALPGLLAAQGWRIRATQLIGHSAGGHLALWLANEDVAVQRIVALAPVADLYAGHAENLDEGAVQALMGGSPAEAAERYAASDPMTRLAQRPDCAIAVVHGTQDDRVPLTQAQALVARYPWIALHELSETEHFAIVDPLSPVWPTVHQVLIEGFVQGNHYEK